MNINSRAQKIPDIFTAVHKQSDSPVLFAEAPAVGFFKVTKNTSLISNNLAGLPRPPSVCVILSL